MIIGEILENEMIAKPLKTEATILRSLKIFSDFIVPSHFSSEKTHSNWNIFSENLTIQWLITSGFATLIKLR